MAERRSIIRTVPFRREAGTRKVYGEVGVPLPRFAPDQVVKRSELDAHRAAGALHYDNCAWDQQAVEELAHRFLVHSRAIDKDHDHRPGVGTPIESYLAPDDIPTRAIHKGAWQLGVDVTEQAAIERMEAGELNGFSVSMLTFDESVEIVVEDDELQADGTFRQERMAIGYFVDPMPLMVSLVGKPATGLPFQVVRCVEDGCRNPKCTHTCKTCIDRQANPANQEPAVKDTTWVAKIWNALRGVAKAEGVELPEMPNLVARQVPDFNAAWAGKEIKDDLRSSFWCFEDVVMDILYDDESTIQAKVAAVQTSTQQFVAFLNALLKQAEDAAKAAGMVTASVREVGNLKVVSAERSIVVRAGKVLSAANHQTLKECLDQITAGAGGIEKFLADVKAAEAADTTTADRSADRSNPKEDDVDVKQELEALKAKLAETEAALVAEKQRSEAEAQVAAELETAKRTLADKEAELARIRAVRPPSSAPADDGVTHQPAKPGEAPRVIRSAEDVEKLCKERPWLSAQLARSSGVELIAADGDDE